MPTRFAQAIAFLLLMYSLHIIVQSARRTRDQSQSILHPDPPATFSKTPRPPFPLQSDIDYVIETASASLCADMDPDDSIWIYPPALGPGFDAAYYFTLVALGKADESQFQTREFCHVLLATQRADGTWDQAHDATSVTGDLDTTIFAYWYLKTVCTADVCRRPLEQAKSAIHALGGVQKSQTMTKFKLASMGQYPWDSDLMQIPLFIFQNRTVLHRLVRQNTFDRTAQWVPEHLKAMAYLAHQQVVFCVGADISELNVQDYSKRLKRMGPETSHCDGMQASEATEQIDADLLHLVHEILNGQQPLGSFGGYTVATELTLLVLHHFKLAWPNHAKALQAQIGEAESRAFQFLERIKLTDAGASKYDGILMDGRWWDTLLVSWALAEAGAEPTLLLRTAATLVENALQPNGGVAYGYDFEYAPDTDDTSLFVLLMSHLGGAFESKIAKSIQWLLSMQNEDGGFPAFHIGKNPFWTLQAGFEWSGVADSAEVFDVSCADLTGHILEALGRRNYTIVHPVVAKAIRFLKTTQSAAGSWEGRWGINNIYAVGAVIPGLKSVGANLTEAWVLKSFQWLLDHQNVDGGFGESPKSYTMPEWVAIGNSTVSQTSWALFALLEAPPEIFPGLNAAVDRAIWFLLNSFHSNGDVFEDISVVGTGHRAILNVQYPAYAKTFPLIALARYKKSTFSHFLISEPYCIHMYQTSCSSMSK